MGELHGTCWPASTEMVVKVRVPHILVPLMVANLIR